MYYMFSNNHDYMFFAYNLEINPNADKELYSHS